MTTSDRKDPVPAGAPASPKRLAIYVIARNAVDSLSAVLDRIPHAVRERAEEILVSDAASKDDTYLVGLGYKAVAGIEKLTVVRAPHGGAGAIVKAGIDHCRQRGYDIVVFLYADGKYAPEAMESLVAPLDRGEVDAVFGSRFLGGALLPRGMPPHKAIAVRLLSFIQERLLGYGLSEYHCGYQALSVPAVATLPYQRNSDELVFYTELAIQLGQKGLRIAEVPVPPYAAAETDGLAGVRYAADVVRAVAQYWLHSRGLREYAKFAIREKYAYRSTDEGSHRKILGLIDKDRQRVLDVGCGAGYLAEAIAVRENHVVGVDARRADGVEDRMARFLQVDLDLDEIPWSGPSFDFVVMGDILEHLREPHRLLAQAHKLLADSGALIVSVPNVAHWSVRLALLFGRFHYTARGILDRSHLRFYTLSSIRAELEGAGFLEERIDTTSPPFDELFRGSSLERLGGLLTRINALGARLARTLFAYQFVIRARKAGGRRLDG